MQSLLERLIAEERRLGNGPGPDHRAAFRICEKLRLPLIAFAGIAGYRSLLARALTLARVEAPLLAGIEIKPDGSFQFSTDLEARLATAEADRAGAMLAGQLLELLAVFIGEALTFRLVHDVWPRAATTDSKSTGKRP